MNTDDLFTDPAGLTEVRRHAVVTITIEITNGETRSFTADTTTTGNIHRSAERALQAVQEDAKDWLWREGGR